MISERMRIARDVRRTWRAGLPFWRGREGAAPVAVDVRWRRSYRRMKAERD
jgi:hypothetical protein